jgi:hypothetical protein
VARIVKGALQNGMLHHRLLLFFVFVLALTSVTSLAGCMGAKERWRAAPVMTQEVRVVPQEIYRRKDRLFVRVTLWNLSMAPLTVDRDGVTAQLSNGAVLGRSSGLTTLHKPYTLPPGATQSIYVDFRDPAMEDAVAANIFWTGAVWDGARQIEVPPTPARLQ